jgi:integrase/recombinase XerD
MDRALRMPLAKPGAGDKIARGSAILHRAGVEGGPVPHLGLEEVRRLMAAARGASRRHGERDMLLIGVLFDACLRVSEALGLRPADIVHDGEGFVLRVRRKGAKWGQVAVSPSLAAMLLGYSARAGVGGQERIFPITRQHAHRLVTRAFRIAGVQKPRGVGAVHVLRHSGALERLRRTGNPRAVQMHLGHASAAMTLRYLRTLAEAEAVRIQQGVDIWTGPGG